MKKITSLSQAGRLEALQWLVTVATIVGVVAVLWQLNQTLTVLRQGQVIATMASACSEHIAAVRRLNWRATASASIFHSARRDEELAIVLDLAETEAVSQVTLYNEAVQPSLSQIALFSNASNSARLEAAIRQYREAFLGLKVLMAPYLSQAYQIDRDEAESGLGGTVSVSRLQGVGDYDAMIDTLSEAMDHYADFVTDYCRSEIATIN